MKSIVITASDQLYTILADDLFASIKALKFKHPFDIGLLDIGIEDAKRARYEAIGVRVVKAGVDIDFPARAQWEAKRPGLRALTAQPFLRRYFPGYDVYIWLDADVWVQTPDAIDTMIEAASASPAVHLSCELDRCYRAFFDDAAMWGKYGNWYHVNFSPEVAAPMMLKPMLNVGVMAMRHDCPAWDAWAAFYKECLQNAADLSDTNFMMHQLGLNILLYQKGIPFTVLPASFNWLTFFALPMLDKDTKRLVEPLPPHRPISQIHLTRPAKNGVEKIRCTDGSMVERKLTFSGQFQN